MDNFITELWQTLEDRKANPTEGSYTTELLQMGEDTIVQKVGEEAVEVIIAAKGQGDQRIIEESADLVYHLLVMLLHKGLSWDDVQAELAKRHKK